MKWSKTRMTGVSGGGIRPPTLTNLLEELDMQSWIAPLKIFGYVVVLLMLVAIAYAAFTSIRYWPSISV